MKTITLSNNDRVSAIGQGTWRLGDDPGLRKKEIQSIRTGIELGMNLIDTAEMYGEGRSEQLVGEAIQPYKREKLYLVSKVLPWNAGLRSMRHSLEQSLRRLGTEYLDLYLCHWRGNIALSETVFCLEQLKHEGKIRAWGFSNMDIDDMEELWDTPDGEHCLVNQVLYHPGSRGIEWSLLPWMNRHRVALMSYCPLAQAGTLKKGLFQSDAVLSIARKYKAEPAQVLLAWNIRDGHTIAIPRSSNPEHARSNALSGELELTEEDLGLLDQAFHPPVCKEPLDTE